METIVYYVMFVGAFLFALIPFGVFLGLSSIGGYNPSTTIPLFVCGLILAVIGYGASFGGFSLIQKNSCNKIQNLNQIAVNAGISTAIITLFYFFAIASPFLRKFIIQLFPLTVDQNLVNIIAIAYWVFWGSLFGLGVGGNFSAICKK